jgi:lipopolysaccharide biosynthesis protein
VELYPIIKYGLNGLKFLTLNVFNRNSSKYWKSTILKTIEISNLGKRVCVFAHYHSSEVSDDVLFYLSELKKDDWSIIFITTGETLSMEELNKTKGFCCSIIKRKNIGYDFGSYALGYYLIDKELTQDLLFCNDSVYGPYQSLANIENKMRKYDCWGLTDSHERSYHLQSYFLRFNHKALSSKSLSFFIAGIKPQKNKRKLIKKFEIGFSSMLQKTDFVIGSFISSKQLIEELSGNQESQTNVTIHFPFALYQKEMPFIKKEVIQSNPAEVDLDPLLKIIDSYSNLSPLKE